MLAFQDSGRMTGPDGENRESQAAVTGYSLLSITSVDFMTTVTVSPTFNFISSALRRVMTDSISFSPTFTTTWAITEPRVTSLILPRSWLRAERIMPRFYIQRRIRARSKDERDTGVDGKRYS